MKIGIDARLWNESGVGRYIRNLIKNLLVLDCKNTYVLFVNSLDAKNIKYQISRLQLPSAKADGGQANIKNKKARDVKIIITDIMWHTIKEQLRFPQILNKENIDLVHFPYFAVPIFYNKLFVVTIHDLIIDHFPTGQASTLFFPFYKIKYLGYKFITSQTTKKAKKIITVSNATKEEIMDHLKINENKIVVTYEGVDEKISNPKPTCPLRREASRTGRSQISNLKSQNYFLYVGNAYPHKNLERLIEAFANIKDKIADTKLVLVGEEDYFYKRLREKVKRISLNESIIFFGEATDEQLIELYRNAKMLIMPSLMEGFSLPVIEAMANKCPVLVSDIPVMHEICQDIATYFNPYDINDLSKKLEEIIHYNDIYHYSDCIEKGFERAKEFSWKKMAEETLKVYEEAI